MFKSRSERFAWVVVPIAILLLVMSEKEAKAGYKEAQNETAMINCLHEIKSLTACETMAILHGAARYDE